jgi:succinate dehydrogenase/fumarate reductase flavoprotein subunit
MVSSDSSAVDLLVLGGGMAGLSAAARAAHDGGSVVLVDKAAELGGSAIYAGFAWTAPSLEAMREINPDGDPELAAAVAEGFADGIEWIRSLGVECKPAVTVLRYGRGHQFDTTHYLARCAEVVREHGGEILTRTQVLSLDTEDGAVTGAELILADGTRRRVQARNTLLATGGFQGDAELRAKHIHPQARDIQLRANPNSTGDGLRLGLEAGAAFGIDNAGFYGHLMPSGVPLSDPSLFTDLALYYSEHSLLFNLRGERFIDETVGDHLTTMALLEQPEARGLLIADAVTYRDWVIGSYVEGIAGISKFDLCRRRGARCAVTDSISEFDLIPPEWGYPGPVIRQAIEDFNDRARSGSALEPTRQFDRRPLDEPPYYVIDATPAITFSMSGLRIDSQARVKSTDGGTVPGLLSAGSDAGGMYWRAYSGGLAPALVFGLAAARTALDDRLGSRAQASGV